MWAAKTITQRRVLLERAKTTVYQYFILTEMLRARIDIPNEVLTQPFELRRVAGFRNVGDVLDSVLLNVFLDELLADLLEVVEHVLVGELEHFTGPVQTVHKCLVAVVPVPRVFVVVVLALVITAPQF